MLSLEEQLKRTIGMLSERGLTFALTGGLAASVYGEERITKDVDFLIGGAEPIADVGAEILAGLGLSASIARQADFDGGPKFAMKKNTLGVALIGRDPGKDSPGVDFLLPTNPWAPRALDRAQHNQLDFGFEKKIPTVTVEDLIVSKLISSRRAGREQDILDLRAIFRTERELDLGYLIARMKEFGATVAPSLSSDAPAELVRASKRISRRNGSASKK